MELICGIIDAQGYMSNGEFIPREISFSNMGGKIFTWDVDTDLSFKEMTIKDRKTNQYIMANIIGLPLKPKSALLDLDEIEDKILDEWQDMKSVEKPYLGLKNKFLAELLDKYGIPYIWINSPSIKRLKSMYNVPYLCKKHFSDHYSCAAHKIALLISWLKKETHNYEIWDL